MLQDRKSIKIIFGILSLAVSTASAIDLKTDTWPLTKHAYEAIDKGSVRIDLYTLETIWLKRTAEMNSALSEDLTFQPVASIDVTRFYTEETLSPGDRLGEEAQLAAARFGANIVFIQNNLMVGTEWDGIRLIAYRVEYKHQLLSPSYLAALPQVSVSGAFLEAELHAWNKAQFGTVQTAEQLAALKSGTPVRIVLSDGSDLRGSFNGLDDHHQLRVQTQDWTRFFRDHVVPTRKIQSVAVLN